nr:photosystem II protein Z [Cyanidiaceae sp.]
MSILLQFLIVLTILFSLILVILVPSQLSLQSGWQASKSRVIALCIIWASMVLISGFISVFV